MSTLKNDTIPDETQWNSMEHVMQFGGIHDNTILYYFAESPFFDRTSNNAVVFSQAVRNQSQLHIIATREAFEARLREMSGLEYIVAQEPAETGPGMGTGVWVIRKQTRRKVKAPGGYPLPDEIEVHADYFVVGENIYMAPSLANILSARIAMIASSISKTFPVADSIQKWSPATGHGYKTPNTNALAGRARGAALDPKEATHMPESQSSGTAARATAHRSAAPDDRLADESFAVHNHYGSEYMDENPITGKPGDFHFSSTGRKDRPGAPGQQQQQQHGKGINSGSGTPLPILKTLPDNSPLSKDVKGDKIGRAGAPKPKRRKSKGGPITPS